ncbi:MAG: hypothetical protein RH917_15670 [Lacipirellulaceae bacterium]
MKVSGLSAQVDEAEAVSGMLQICGLSRPFRFTSMTINAMEPTPIIRLKCNSVPYRQGFIEVTPSIHDGHINIETWNIKPEASLDNVSWVDDRSVPDADVLANIELELTAGEAERLAGAILAAIKALD